MRPELLIYYHFLKDVNELVDYWSDRATCFHFDYELVRSLRIQLQFTSSFHRVYVLNDFSNGDLNQKGIDCLKKEKKMFDYVLNYKFYWIEFYYYYLQSGTDIELKLQELRQLGHSQDDLDRIEKIANQSQVVDPQEPPIGRKTSATLLEIERNRQLILVQQGAQVPFNFFFLHFHQRQ